MSILTVKLTATGGSDTSTNPGNSQHCDLATATLGNLDRLDRNRGDHDGSSLGTITQVEAYCKADSVGAEQYDITSGFGIFEDIFQGESDDTLQYFDITALKPWLWSDFAADADLHIFVDWGGIADLEVDCIGFRITYTPTSRARKGTSGFLALIHNMVFFKLISEFKQEFGSLPK